MKSRSQKGFSVVEFIIIALVVAVVGFVGYSVYDRQQNKITTESSQASDVSSAPEIKNIDGLGAAEAVLDQTDTSSSADSRKLDKQLNSF